jgi:hypothetical protein
LSRPQCPPYRGFAYPCEASDIADRQLAISPFRNLNRDYGKDCYFSGSEV